MKKIAFLSLFIQFGCASIAKETQIQNSSEFNKDKSKIYNTSLQLLSKRGIIKSTDTNSGLISFETTDDSFFDCGSSGIAAREPSNGIGSILVSELDKQKSSVVINMTKSVNDTLYGSNGFLGGGQKNFKKKCFSTGKLENEILSALSSSN